MSNKFYICEHCGNIIEKIEDKKVPVVCCGEKMKPLIAGTVEASREKHIPVVSIGEGEVKVEVGSVSHPMEDAHSILWVYLETNLGSQRKNLEVGKPPVVSFSLSEGEIPVAVYAYCNLHGLWMSEI